MLYLMKDGRRPLFERLLKGVPEQHGAWQGLLAADKPRFLTPTMVQMSFPAGEMCDWLDFGDARVSEWLAYIDRLVGLNQIDRSDGDLHLRRVLCSTRMKYALAQKINRKAMTELQANGNPRAGHLFVLWLRVGAEIERRRRTRVSLLENVGRKGSAAATLDLLDDPQEEARIRPAVAAEQESAMREQLERDADPLYDEWYDHHQTAASTYRDFLAWAAQRNAA
jgi:hypothetical protein